MTSTPTFSTATSTGASAAISRCHILSIPAELRLVIYEHYFKDFEPQSNHESIPKKATFQPPLLHACSVFEVEALPLYKKHLETRREEMAGTFECFNAHMTAWRNSCGPEGGLHQALAAAEAVSIVKRKRNECEARDVPFATELRQIGWLHVMEEIRTFRSWART